MTFVTRTISALRAIFLPLGLAKVILWLGIGLLLSVPAMAQAPVVSNVVAQQRSGTKLVDITYDVTAVTPTVTISLRISNDNGATYNIPAETVSGAVGVNVTKGNGKVITWNAGVDWKGNYNTGMRFEVTADDGVIAPTITTQPASQIIASGSTATLTVAASGSTPLTYQWYQGAVGTTTTPVGTNSSSFTTPALTATTSYWVRVSNSAGSVNSSLASITCSPTITTQPATQVIASGSTATLTVTASGSTPLTYQWYQGAVGTTTTPVGTNSSSFTTPALTATTSYWVRVSNSAGSVNSSLASITCSPTITTQPASQTIASGSTATLTVTASGSSPLTYQWYQGAVGTTTTPVGTNSSSFTTPTLSEGTTYWVRVNNTAGSVNSSQASVIIDQMLAELALIPAGSFTMGSTSGDADPDSPPVTVNVSAFYMGKNEVTKDLWVEVRNWATTNGYTDIAAGAGKASNHPIQTVSWWDVIKWCNARSEKEGLTPCYTIGGEVMKTGTTIPAVNWTANGYRLPTEAEWEKAARGGVSGKRFPWGTDTISHAEANFKNNGSESYKLGTSGFHPTYATGTLTYTSPVGSFAANGFGLNDMAGNIFEWCWDWYGVSTYVNGETDPRGAASGGARVIRGGCWNDSARLCRAANRKMEGSATRNIYLGFRIARSSDASEMTFIPAGNFTMGSTSGDSDPDSPPVTVNVSAFYMGKNEVTKDLWVEVRNWATTNGYTDIAAGAGKASNHPIQTVSWWDVIKWCNARSEKEGLTPCYTIGGEVMKTGTTIPAVNWTANGYRLPTEAEWEKAARGGVSGKRFPWGTDTISHNEANFFNYGSDPYQSGTTGYHPSYASGFEPYTSPVGSFLANGFGLNDTAGNVLEWCWDWYGASTYANGAQDPRGAEPGSDTGRVLRGGCWPASGRTCAASYRGFSAPMSEFNTNGFRVARSSVP